MKSKPPVCCRKIGFDAGHRVVNHESKCAHLHGHRYTVEIYATQKLEQPPVAEVLVMPKAEYLDDVGRVIDFSVLKERIGGWIDDAWDHGLILWAADPLLKDIKNMIVATPEVSEGRCIGIMQKYYEMPYNPTAENMAKYLLEEICPRLLGGTGVYVTKIRLWETPNCFAEAERK